MSKLYNIDMEIRTICSVCDGSDTTRNFLLATLTRDHFGYTDCQGIWIRIETLAKEGKSIPSIHTLKHDPALEESARTLIDIEEIELVRTEEDTRALLSVLERYRKYRVLYFGMRQARQNIETEDPTDENLDETLEALEGVLNDALTESFNKNDSVFAGEKSTIQPVLDRILSKNRPPKIPTGFKKFDDAAGGFSRKNVVVLAANTGGGKTVCAIQMACNIAHAGYNVNLVGFEMDEDEYTARMLSCITGIDHHLIDMRKLTTTQIQKARDLFNEWEKEVASKGATYGLLCPTQDMTPTKVDFHTRREDLDVLIVDYIGLVSGYEKKQREERLSDLVRDFKKLANSRNCVVIILAQMDDETLKVKYSKAITHHASFVWKWFYDKNQESIDGKKTVKVIQEKVRNCVPFDFVLTAEYDKMRMFDWDGPEDVTVELHEDKSLPASPKVEKRGRKTKATPTKESAEPARLPGAKPKERRGMPITPPMDYDEDAL